MAVRVRFHDGEHTWVLKSSSGVCKDCLAVTGQRMPMKMKWVCNVDGCKGKKTTRHAHVF